MRNGLKFQLSGHLNGVGGQRVLAVFSLSLTSLTLWVSILLEDLEVKSLTFRRGPKFSQGNIHPS